MSYKLVAILAAIAFCGPARAETWPWMQMVQGGAEARAVTDAPQCPDLRVDGRPHAMRERAQPAEGFPNRVCAAAIPPGARRLSIDGRALPVLSKRPSRIVVLGDSGCRLKGHVAQHCNDPSGWPFARVAALAAAKKPDLIIHVGDYYYRETPCPASEAACAGSPFGDRWATWKAEVFDPAAPLLAAAPVVFTRGNHEDCARGGAGWFRLFDAAPAPLACPAESATWSVHLRGLTLFVVDSADTEDATAPGDLVAAFRRRLDPVAGSERAPAWIVTHRPIWDSMRAGPLLADGVVNQTERAAVKDLSLAGVQLVLSGHVHNFTALDFGSGRPPQLVVGTGGDVLNKGDFPPPAIGSASVDGLSARIFTMGRFGYFLFDRRGRDWVGEFRGLDDRVVARCRLNGRSLECAEVKA
ncbi:MAG: metallophosphoesterase [Caulobacteraceae bacterium]|nr:metallophosphoesterase [Caulobacteraceae bacterium]